MASIPVVGTRWREVATGKVVEVNEVYQNHRGEWLVTALNVDGSKPGLIAWAHWFCTEGYKSVEDAA